MAKRYGRRRVDGIFEYSESVEDLEASAVREDREALRGSFALVGLLLGGVVTYGLVNHHAPDWPKIIRFISVLAGGCLSAYVFASLAVLLRMMLFIVTAIGVLGGIGYLVWKLL